MRVVHQKDMDDLIGGVMALVGWMILLKVTWWLVSPREYDRKRGG